MGAELLGSHVEKHASFYNHSLLMQGHYTSSTWGKLEWRSFGQKSRLLLLENPGMTSKTLGFEWITPRQEVASG